MPESKSSAALNSSLGISLAAAMAASERIAVRRNIVTGCGARLNECAVGSVESEVDYRFIPQNLDIRGTEDDISDQAAPMANSAGSRCTCPFLNSIPTTTPLPDQARDRNRQLSVYPRKS